MDGYTVTTSDVRDVIKMGSTVFVYQDFSAFQLEPQPFQTSHACVKTIYLLKGLHISGVWITIQIFTKGKAQADEALQCLWTKKFEEFSEGEAE